MMVFYLKVWFLTTVAFLGIDLLWLGVVMKNFYQSQLADFLIKKNGELAPIWWAALIVYVAIPTGLILFVLPRVMGSDSPLVALGWGSLFGLILYAVYDFTNYSLVKGWPLKMVMVDVIWGTVVCGVSSVIMFYIVKWLG